MKWSEKCLFDTNKYKNKYAKNKGGNTIKRIVSVSRTYIPPTSEICISRAKVVSTQHYALCYVFVFMLLVTLVDNRFLWFFRWCIENRKAGPISIVLLRDCCKTFAVKLRKRHLLEYSSRTLIQMIPLFIGILWLLETLWCNNESHSIMAISERWWEVVDEANQKFT